MQTMTAAWFTVPRRCLSPSWRRRPLLIPSRSSSTAAHAKTLRFTSFFFANEQWMPNVAAHRPPAAARDVAAVEYRRSEELTARRLVRIYVQLAKSRLTVLNVLAAMSGVALSPLPATMPVLLSITLGTTLCSASANALNELQEIPFDAQMARTRMRPLVRRAISPLHAAGFALTTGLAGPAILCTMVNPTTACLGAANVLLYAGLYTWLKRKSVVNTWVGAVVGAIPPLMGWAACGGQIMPSADHPIALFLPSFLATAPTDLALVNNPLAALALFSLLFSWQFPHFNALSYVVRGSYAQAGYRMLSITNPAKNSLVSLRHALFLVPLCSVFIPLSGLTTWAFALTSLPPNLFCAREAWRFWKNGGEKQARLVFQHSLWYLPVMLGLMMLHKQGMDWGSWISWIGLGEKAPDVQEQQT